MNDPEFSRRRLLAGLGGGGIVGAGLGAIVPRVAESPIDSVGDAPPTEEATDPVPETDSPYAVFQYESVAGEYIATAPINVVFPLEEASFGEVVDVFREARWSRRPSEYARYAYDREADSWHRSHWSGAESVFGVISRLHVRCWALAGTASIQAHIDSNATPRHRIVSYADGARAVATLFAAAGWSVDPADPETVDLRNARGPDHPGEAVVIRR